MVREYRAGLQLQLYVHGIAFSRLVVALEAELLGEFEQPGQMHCSDGATATFSFQRLSIRRGHGVGSFSRGAMSFAYGLSAEEAAPYLKLPEGKKLAYNGKELKLVDL